MTQLEAAMVDMAALLEELRIPYMVIGGFANLHWGVQRFTRDLDITVGVADEELPSVLSRIEKKAAITTPDPLAFARRNHLIRARSRSGVDVDLILAALPYEFEAIRRAVEVPVLGVAVRICSAEDLIVHKLAAQRPQDLVDVEGIVARRARELDRDYLRARVGELAAGMEQPELPARLDRLLEDADRRATEEAGRG